MYKSYSKKCYTILCKGCYYRRIWEKNIDFSEILSYDELTDPSKVVDDAVQLLKGKKDFREIIIGIDPGKRLDLAVLGDGIILIKNGTHKYRGKIKGNYSDIKRN